MKISKKLRPRHQLDGFESQREAAQRLKRRERDADLARVDASAARTHKAMARLEAEAREMPVAGQTARSELAVADQVLSQRRELAVIAARISPPAYVRSELGGRAIRRSGRHGIAASPGSSATARSTASRTRTKPLAGRRNEGPSGHASRPQRDDCKRFSESWAWGSTRREHASSAVG